ncbi:S8 family serine peptidase [Actinoplanes sp. NPDC023801]|uniref:S8 family serine peptidase n=1 Tax=Actinoplanes sp. NPDC023801 TaxID=3154595 RepID=UPI0033F7098F
MRARNSLRRRARMATAAIAAGVLPLALAAAAPAQAAPTRAGLGADDWSGIWLSNGGTTSATTTLAQVRTTIGADTGAARSLTGKGVGIALIDTGVAPVPGIPAAQVVNGPDLSFESQSGSLRYLDTYGHGTHMAGIIIGNDAATGTRGIAPGAKLTSIKVGTANGAVDVTQMIAAIDWVVENRNHDPLNPIKVISLSYGTGGNPTVWNDPLSLAVQQAWKAGIMVVAAAGNQGNGYGKLTHPAADYYALSVGATAPNGTTDPADDTLTSFTNLSTNGRPLDLLAPGSSIPSLRVPGSNVDNGFPSARVGDTLFRGSGTSQAAAVTAAAAALVLQARPALTPGQLKSVLMQGVWLPKLLAGGQGAKQIDVNMALAATPGQTWTSGDSDGSGTLEATRGSSHVVANNVTLTGQKSIFGPFDTTAWAARTKAETAWSGGTWMGHRMAADGWTGTSYASKTWGPATWAGGAWGGTSSWTDPAWSGRTWNGRFWAAGTWTGRFWASDDWSTGYWG